MKTSFYLICILLVSFSLTANLRAHPIQEGDSLQTTLDAMGKPIGRIDLSERTLLLYPEGQVTLIDGKISTIELQSPAKFAKAQAQRAEQREEWQQQQARLAEQRRMEGAALRDEQLNSQGFAQMSAKQRFEFWTEFRARYPEVDISEPLAEAREHYHSELEMLRAKNQLAELESRIAAAEREAATARLETEQLRRDAELYRRQTLRYSTRPVYAPHYPYPTRNIIIHRNRKETEPCETTPKPVVHTPHFRHGLHTSFQQQTDERESFKLRIQR